jgi:serine/threonine-protein kinase
VDPELKDLLYSLAQRYEQKSDLVGAKTVYKHLFAHDITYRDVKDRFELLSGATSDPLAFEKTSILNSLSEEAKRRYELLEEVGRGAMGIVYRAHDNELQEIVALKILPDNLSNNPEAVRRFKAEARSARRLSHPHIVRIHDIGEEMGRKYISMEFVAGTDLKKRIRSEGPVPFESLLSYAKQICSAIAYAHKVGIVHRDLKPANVMLDTEGQIKVTDFGIAKIVESTEATLAGAVIGTPLYMSPEQVQGVSVDERADIYSLGILFYELHSAHPPFTQGDLAHQHLHAVPKRLEGCPREFADLVGRCLEKKRENRWASAAEMLEALKTIS